MTGQKSTASSGSSNRFAAINAFLLVWIVSTRSSSVASSAGAACSSGSIEPSRVLVAMGRSPEQARASLRFSFGHGNSEADVERLAGLLPDLVERVRKQNNRIWLRTTMLVGHPGESEEAYINLRKFIEEGYIDHLGVFPWSKEDGTTSAMRPGRIDLAIAEGRAAELMAIQEQLRLRRHLEMVGQEIEVMIDGVSDESEFLLDGRHEGQAPDIDGKCIVTDGTAERGDFVKTRIINATAHELVVSMDLDRPVDETAVEALEDLD